MRVVQGIFILLWLIACLITLPTSQAVSPGPSDPHSSNLTDRGEFKKNIAQYTGTDWLGLSNVAISNHIDAQQFNRGSQKSSDISLSSYRIVADTQLPDELMPDLVVTSISAPDKVYFEEPFTVSWTVYNQGDGNTAPIVWQDEVWLTDSEFGDETFIFLGYCQNKHALAPCQSYTSSLQVSIEDSISPDYYYCLTVFTDAGYVVPECNEGNNARCKLIEVQEHISYTITPSAGPNGSISPDSPVTVEPGDNQQFTAYPNFSYQVDTWYLDGGPVQTSGEIYVLEDIQANHTVYVTFKRLHGYSLNTIEFNDEREFLRSIVHNIRDNTLSELSGSRQTLTA